MKSFVSPVTHKSKTVQSVHAKLLNLEGMSLQAVMLLTWSRVKQISPVNITANISKAGHVIGVHLVNDVMYS